MVDWTRPIGLELITGKMLPARNAKLDIDGLGSGTIGVYIYGREVLTDAQAAQFDFRYDLGAIMAWAEELTGFCKFGRVVNVDSEMLDSTLYDVGSGRMFRVPESEVRKRVAAAAEGDVPHAPLPAKPIKMYATIEYDNGWKENIGSLEI